MRKPSGISPTLLLLLCCCLPFSLVAQSLPRIIVLSTGGTIAGQQPNQDRAAYLPGKLTVQDLLKTIPGLEKKVRVSGEQMANISSSQMTIQLWLQLAKRINAIAKNKEADGIVVTHGTDTQEETAYFLSLTTLPGVPIVITGSMRPATAISADGPKNLADAILVAAAPQSKGRGVILCFNDNLYDPQGVTKVHTSNVNAFAAPQTGPIGGVHDGQVQFFHPLKPSQRHSAVFDISQADSLPRVEIVYAYADAGDFAVEALVKRHVPGIVVAGTGNGGFSTAIRDALQVALKENIVVVRSTRVLAGGVTNLTKDLPEDPNKGTLVSGDLNPQKARILLMLALTQTNNKEQIQELFLTMPHP